MLTLLGIPGALRAASTNRLLLAEARRAFGDAHHTEADLRFPLFDEDLEIAEGFPEAVTTLHAQIKAADAIVIATPEYNKALPGVLKNALDWVSRVPGAAWRDKPVAILIGGPDGLDPALRAEANEQIRLSSLTLPHMLVRVLLAEQLFRAWSVISNHPYHRA